MVGNLARTWEQLAKHGVVTVERLRNPVAESWARCLHDGVSPFLRQAPVAVDSTGLVALCLENNHLVEAAGAVIERLAKVTAGTDHMIVLCDRHGRLLRLTGDPEVEFRAHPHNFFPGCDWSEEAAGTNAIGTALRTGQPVQVFAFEHFCINSHNWSCAAAPIRDPLGGEIIGVVDLTGGYQSFQPHSLGLVLAAVQEVEQVLRHRLSAKEELMLNLFWEHSLDHLPDGVMAVTEDGRVMRVNRTAASLLGEESGRLLGREAATLGELGELLRQTLVRRHPSLTGNLMWTTSRGLRRPLRATCYPVEAQGRPIGALALLREELQPVIYSHSRLVEPRPAFETSTRYTFETLIGRSPGFLEAVERSRKAARGNATVLLLGESGTGKEGFAQAIHAASPRGRGPFVAVNCGAVPHELVASELFGYAEGAFTGARRQGQAGKFEAAHGGTLFLDEIGEAPSDFQVMLLRALQEREVMRIGSTRRISVDVRVIAATNVDLSSAIAGGRFRSDLFYRLSVIPIRLPVLLERPEDIPLLAEHFLERIARDGSERKRLAPDALERLQAYSWPGNVRELENVLLRSASLSEGEWISASDIDLRGAGAPGPLASRVLIPVAAVRCSDLPGRSGRRRRPGPADLQEAVRSTGGNLKEAARQLGISRATLYRYLGRLGLGPDRLRTDSTTP